MCTYVPIHAHEPKKNQISPIEIGSYTKIGDCSKNVVNCSVLRCVAISCSVLQCVAVWCNALQCGAMRCSVVQCAFSKEMWQFREPTKRLHRILLRRVKQKKKTRFPSQRALFL